MSPPLPARTCRIIFMGTPAFAVPALVALAERPDLCTLVAVVTQPPRPAGRGRKLTACPVQMAAEARQIPALSPTRLKRPETHAALAAYDPDLAVVAAYGRLLPPALLALPKHGCVNVHASLLPRHRGASPIAHAILAGDPQVGVSIMRMDAGLDTGPVYSQRRMAADPGASCGALTVRLAELGASLLVDTLPGLLDGSVPAVPQPDQGVTLAPLLTKAHGWLDPATAATTLARQVAAYSPWPGAQLALGAAPVQVLRAHPDPGPHDVAGAAPPGQILEASGRGVLMATGTGALWLDEVKPAGKRTMSAAAWVAGRGVAAGARLAQWTAS